MTEISKNAEPKNLEQNKQVARRGGRIAGNARREIVADTGKPVITSKSASQLNATLLTDTIESVTDNSGENEVSISPPENGTHEAEER